MKKGVGRYILITLLGCMAIGLIVIACISMPYIIKIKNLAEEAKAIIRAGSEADFAMTRTSIVYDANNEVLLTYSGEKDLYYVQIEDVPQTLIDSFVVMEDKDFYSHQGIDLKAVIRAAMANYDANEIVQGASTITQQVARNIYLNQDVNWERKIKEAFMAMEMEKKYDKNLILEYYLNNIYFGNGLYGVEAAARGYLDKNVAELTAGECIFLASIPNNPSRYNPISHEENTVERARRILTKLHENSMISDLDFLLLSSEEKNPFVNNLNGEINVSNWNRTTGDSYVYTYVTHCAVRYLMEENGFIFKNSFTSNEELDKYDTAYDAWYTYYLQGLYTGGYKIYTSIDIKAQRQLQDTVDEIIAQNDAQYMEYRESGRVIEEENPLQAAAVTLDNETGYVIAIVGGRNEETYGYGFNRAYQSYRQPGSSIKPLNVYTPYLSLGHSENEPVYDIYDEDGPRNAGGAYAGKMTLKEAVMYSKNTIAWQIYRYLTPQKGNDYLLRLGFKKIYMDSNYMSCALGGFTYGVSCEEMATGFRTIANGGIYNNPTCIKGIVKEDVSWTLPNVRTGDFVFEENATRIMTSLLKEVVSEGTGKRAALTAHTIAGKTGTTNSNKDMWFVGYSTYYTTSVWVGYDYPQEVSDKNGNLAVTIWHDYMEKLHIGLPPEEFEQGDYVFPELNMALTDKIAAYEIQLGEQSLDAISENDMDAIPFWGTDEDGTITGDEDITIPTGDQDAVGVTIDENTGVTGGDSDSTISGGDANAAVTGGDSTSAINGGDVNTTVTGGDTDSIISGGDANSGLVGGDESSTLTGIE